MKERTNQRGVAADPLPAVEIKVRNRSGQTARVRVKGDPPGGFPGPGREFEIPPPEDPALPDGEDAAAPISPPANLTQYSAEAQYLPDPAWFECAPELVLPESRATVIVQLNANNAVEWSTE